MKRVINFVGTTYQKSTSKLVTIRLSAVKTTRLRQTHIKTDGGYHDVTVDLDRWGRLKAVKIERSRH